MYIAITQRGQPFFIRKHPRKELLEQIGVKHAEKMYRDRKDGTYHVGYVISGHWLEVFGTEGLTFAKKEDR